MRATGCGIRGCCSGWPPPLLWCGASSLAEERLHFFERGHGWLRPCFCGGKRTGGAPQAQRGGHAVPVSSHEPSYESVTGANRVHGVNAKGGLGHKLGAVDRDGATRAQRDDHDLVGSCANALGGGRLVSRRNRGPRQACQLDLV